MQLAAGDQFIHARGTNAQVKRQVGANAAFAWQSGHLAYADAPLAEVVDDLNRYFSRAMRIEGEGANRLTFSGIIAIDSEDKVVERLEALLPIDATRAGNEVVLRLRK